MIELQGVQRRYEMNGQAVHALAGVDLNVGAGESAVVALTARDAATYDLSVD